MTVGQGRLPILSFVVICFSLISIITSHSQPIGDDRSQLVSDLVAEVDAFFSKIYFSYKKDHYSLLIYNYLYIFQRPLSSIIIYYNCKCFSYVVVVRVLYL
jgi:hypothetical protein